MFNIAVKLKNLQIKINFHYLVNDNLLKGKLSLNDENEIKFIHDLNKYYSINKQIVLSLDYSSTFNSISKSILSKSKHDIIDYDYIKITAKKEQLDKFLSEENSEKLNNKFKEEIYQTKEIKIEEISNINLSSEYIIYFFIVINEEKYRIDNNISVGELLNEIKIILNNDELNKNNELRLFFEFANKIEICEAKSLKNLKSTHRKIDNIANIQEKLFYFYYSETILANKAIYNVKRLSPFLYLISLIELCVNNYPDLFCFRDKLTDNLMENPKVTTLLTKQVRDSEAISSSSIPSWCKDVCCNFAFLASFNSRYLFFKMCSFDIKRSMINVSNYAKNILEEAIIDEKTLASYSKRRKYKVDREDIVIFAEKIFNEIGNYDVIIINLLKGYLEIEYFDESGTGNGPTLEFYSLFAKEIREKNETWIKTSDLSLFPIPYLVPKEETQKTFLLMGYIMARGLYDDRLMDIPLNSLFWDIVLDRVIKKNYF